MSHSKRSKLTIWTAITVALFALTQDFWSWGDTVPLGPFGVPRWVYIFALLQFALAGVLFWFGKGLRRSSSDRAAEPKDRG